jgi:hypothetical protein
MIMISLIYKVLEYKVIMLNYIQILIKWTIILNLLNKLKKLKRRLSNIKYN